MLSIFVIENPLVYKQISTLDSLATMESDMKGLRKGSRSQNMRRNTIRCDKIRFYTSVIELFCERGMTSNGLF